jgi:hypothetical protein
MKFYNNWLLIYNCQEMSAVILRGLYGALRYTVYVGRLDVADITMYLFSLSILLHFDGR